MPLTDCSISPVQPPLQRLHSTLALRSPQPPGYECAFGEPLVCLDSRKTTDPVTEGSCKASRIGWDKIWAFVNVAVEPQNTQRAGTKREDTRLGRRRPGTRSRRSPRCELEAGRSIEVVYAHQEV